MCVRHGMPDSCLPIRQDRNCRSSAADLRSTSPPETVSGTPLTALRRRTSLASMAARREHGGMQPSIPWPPAGAATDERLAFVAAQPYLTRRARPWWLSMFRIIEAGGGSAYVADRGMAKVAGGVLAKRTITDEMRGDAMAHQVIACDIAAQSLSTEERAHLRQTGELPAWFLPRIDAEAARLKKEQRSSR